VGDVIELMFCIEPTCGVLEWGGRLNGKARVLRIRNISSAAVGDDREHIQQYVAAEFVIRPRVQAI
jgi:hypothetical protein